MNVAVWLNAASPLTTPTYDGSNQAVHPDVYDAGSGNLLHGYRYWMAMTPYPSSNDDYENPSLLVSSDGLSWSVPTGLTNPLVAAPTDPTHNADPDLVVDGTTMYVVYKRRVPGTSDTALLLTSTDGVTWGSPTTLFTTTTEGFASPCVVKVGSTWHMWSVDYLASPKVLRHRTASAINGTWSSGTTCTINNLPSGRFPWHVDVILDEDGSTFHALLNTIAATGDADRLLLMRGDSTGELWRAGPEIIGPGATGQFDANLAYRGCLVPTTDEFRCWYSGQSAAGAWRIGYTEIPRWKEPALP